jgi:hypothetical protein
MLNFNKILNEYKLYRIQAQKQREKRDKFQYIKPKNSSWVPFIRTKFVQKEQTYVESFFQKFYIVYVIPKKIYKVWYLKKFFLLFCLQLAIFIYLFVILCVCIVLNSIYIYYYLFEWFLFIIHNVITDPDSSYNIYNNRFCWIWYHYSQKLINIWAIDYLPKIKQIDWVGINRRDKRHYWTYNTPHSYFKKLLVVQPCEEFWFNNLKRYLDVVKNTPVIGSVTFEEEGLGHAFNYGKFTLFQNEMKNLERKYISLESYDIFNYKFYTNIAVLFETLYWRLEYRSSLAYTAFLDYLFGYKDINNQQIIIYTPARKSIVGINMYHDLFFKRNSSIYLNKTYGLYSHLLPTGPMANIVLGERSKNILGHMKENEDNDLNASLEVNESLVDIIMYAEEAYNVEERNNLDLAELFSTYMPQTKKQIPGFNILMQLSSPATDTQIHNVALSYFVYYMFRICFFFNLYYQFLYLLSLKLEFKNDLIVLDILENNIDKTLKYNYSNIPNLVTLFYIELKDYIEQESFLTNSNEIIDPKGNRSYKRYLYFLLFCKRQWVNNFEFVCVTFRVENWFFDVYLLPLIPSAGDFIERLTYSIKFIPRKSFLSENFMKIFVDSYQDALINSKVSFLSLLSYFDNRHYDNATVKMSNKHILFKQVRNVHEFLFTEEFRGMIFMLMFFYLSPLSVSYDIKMALENTQDVNTFITTHGKNFISHCEMFGQRFVHVNVDTNQRYRFLSQFSFNNGQPSFDMTFENNLGILSNFGSTTNDYLVRFFNMYKYFEKLEHINIVDQKFFVVNANVLNKLTQKEVYLQKIRWQHCEKFFERFPIMYVFFYINQLHKYLKLSIEDTTNIVAEVLFAKELENVKNIYRKNLTNTAQWTFFFSSRYNYLPQIYKIPLFDFLDYTRSPTTLNSVKLKFNNPSHKFTHYPCWRFHARLRFDIGRLYTNHFPILKIMDISKDYFYTQYSSQICRINTFFRQLPDLNLADFFGDDESDPANAKDVKEDILGSLDALQLVLEVQEKEYDKRGKKIENLISNKKIFETHLTALKNNLAIYTFYEDIDVNFSDLGIPVNCLFENYEEVPNKLVNTFGYVIGTCLNYISDESILGYIKNVINFEWKQGFSNQVDQIKTIVFFLNRPKEFDLSYQNVPHHIFYVVNLNDKTLKFPNYFFFYLWQDIINRSIHKKHFTFLDLLGLKVCGELYTNNLFSIMLYNTPYKIMLKLVDINYIMAEKEIIYEILDVVHLKYRTYPKHLLNFIPRENLVSFKNYMFVNKNEFLTNKFALALYNNTSEETKKNFIELWKFHICEIQKRIRQKYMNILIEHINYVEKQINFYDEEILVEKNAQLNTLVNFKKKLQILEFCRTMAVEKLFWALQMNLHSAQFEFDEDNGTLSDSKPWEHYYFDRINFVYGENYHSTTNLFEFIFAYKKDGRQFPWETNLGMEVAAEIKGRVFDSYIKYRKENPFLFYYQFTKLLFIAPINTVLFDEISDKLCLDWFATRWTKTLGDDYVYWHLLFNRFLGIEMLEVFMSPLDYKIFHRNIELEFLQTDNNNGFRKYNFFTAAPYFGPNFLRNNTNIRDCLVLNEIDNYNIQRSKNALGRSQTFGFGRNFSIKVLSSSISNFILTHELKKNLTTESTSETNFNLVAPMLQLQPNHYGYIEPNIFFYDSSLDLKVKLFSKRLTDEKFAKEALTKLDTMFLDYKFKPIMMRNVHPHRLEQIKFIKQLDSEISPYVRLLRKKALKFKKGTSFIDFPIFSDAFRTKCKLFEKLYDSKVVTIPVWFDKEKDFDESYLLEYESYYNILSKNYEKNPRLLAALDIIESMEKEKKKTDLCEAKLQSSMQIIYLSRFTI